MPQSALPLVKQSVEVPRDEYLLCRRYHPTQESDVRLQAKRDKMCGKIILEVQQGTVVAINIQKRIHKLQFDSRGESCVKSPQ